MATKEIRQAARRDAQEVLARRRAERATVEAAREGFALAAMTALAERRALVLAAERQAGAALAGLVGTGLSVRDAVGWLEGVTEKEAARLIKLAADRGGEVGVASP